MKSIFSAALAALLLAGNVQATTQTAQQTRMVTCNKQAGAKQGDERATFMKHGLAGGQSSGSHHHKSGTKGTHTHSKTSAATGATTAAAHPAPAAAITPSAQ